MVGGVVIGLSITHDKIHVNVADCPHYPTHGRGDECPRLRAVVRMPRLHGL